MARQKEVNSATFRFYGVLNEFLPQKERAGAVHRSFRGRVAVKHLIEALGIPHVEVELILAGGASVDFSYLVRPGDRIAVYPAFSKLDVSSIIKVRPPFTNPYRFVLDGHLGRLAAYLRLLGFDTLYRTNYNDDELACISRDERRILVTRDRGLAKRKVVIYGCCLSTRDPKEQLETIIHRYNLHDLIKPWRRCLRCNDRLQHVPKQSILHRLETKTKLYYDTFHLCRTCDHVYWKGSHYSHMQQFLSAFTLVN
jgi:uncharacterized protein with PIN domain